MKEKHNHEAETRFLWEWAASNTPIRMPNPLPAMTWDAEDVSLGWHGQDMNVRFHVAAVRRGQSKMQVAVITATGKGEDTWQIVDEREVPEVVTRTAKACA